MNITMFTHTHSNSSTSPSQGSGSNVCQSSTKTCENVSNPHEGIQRGKPKRRSPTTQPNVTVANQFTVKLQQAPKASRTNTCISIIYHSCRAIPILNKEVNNFLASRSSTCKTSTSSRKRTNLIFWQNEWMVLKTTTVSWINFSIIQKLRKNLRQRSFIVASEWLQESVSRTCFPFWRKFPNSSSSSSTKTTTTTPKISEKSFNHSEKLQNFWRSQKIFFLFIVKLQPIIWQ